MYKFSQLWWIIGMRTNKAATKSETIINDPTTDTWIDNEVRGCSFKDVRLAKRFSKLLGMMSEGIGESVPYACQDWANTKAAYRFFSNAEVSEDQIMAGHFQATRDRLSQAGQKILMLHDTCEFSFQRDKDSKIGLLGRPACGKGKDGRIKFITVRGILMHSSLAITLDGLPLGLAAIKFWTRKQFKGCNALKRKINPTRVPIAEKESFRWLENLRQSTALTSNPGDCVHIGDRESDIFELFSLADELGTNFLVRTCVDRLAQDAGTTVAAEMKKAPVKGRHRVQGRNKQGESYEADLDIKYEQLQVLPPEGKWKDYTDLTLTVIHATERGTPRGREKIAWKLLTNLPVKTLQSAIEKLNWYAMRWKIEVFHKILKSGCKAEDSKLRSSERLVNLISIFCIIGWRVFWLTMLHRAEPDLPPAIALDPTEIFLLDELIKPTPAKAHGKATISDYIIKIARLGGYLNRASDPPPGNRVMWRGLTKLNDIHLGFLLGAKSCG
jgi:Transposase DNA-binding/Transposase Tn5 dimerisation domain